MYVHSSSSLVHSSLDRSSLDILLRASIHSHTPFLFSYHDSCAQINVRFSDGPVEMLGEVQIHLAQTHALKQQEHIFYEIRRAKSIVDLRPKNS